MNCEVKWGIEKKVCLKCQLKITFSLLPDKEDKVATGSEILMIPLLLKFRSWLSRFIFSHKLNMFKIVLLNVMQFLSLIIWLQSKFKYQDK